jgi:hypothetical protein
MIATDSRQAEFSSNEIDTLEAYHPVNRVAIASLVTGLASAAALLNPLLWGLPAVAVVLALFALFQIRKSNGEQRGAVLAKVGFGVAMFFASWSLSWYMTDYYVLTKQARVYGDEWINLLREGKIYEAHQLALPGSQRAKNGTSLNELYDSVLHENHDHDKAEKQPKPPAREEEAMRRELPMAFREFVGGDPMKQLVAIGQSWQFTFARVVSVSRSDRLNSVVNLEYEISYTENERPAKLHIVLRMQRTLAAQEAQWHVSTVSRPQS